MKNKIFILFIISLVFSILFVSVIKYRTGNLSDMHGSSDMDVYSAIQLKFNNDSLYKNDYYFNSFYDKYPTTINTFISFIMSLTNSKYLAYILINYSLFILFWIGNYFLGKYVFKDELAGAIYATISAYGAPALYATNWGIILGVVSTRDFATIFIPYIILFFLKSLNNEKKLYFVFLLIGVIINLHLITGIGILMILSLSYFFYFELYKSKILFNQKTLKHIFLFFLFFLIGAIPFIIRGISLEKHSLDMDLVQFRIGYQYIIPISKIITCFGIPLFFAFFGYKIKKNNNKDKFLFYMLLTTILLCFVLWIISFYSTFIAAFQLVRLSKFIYVFIYLYIAYLIWSFSNKKNYYKLIGIILFFSFLIPPYYMINKVNNFLSDGISLDFRSQEIKELNNKYLKINKVYGTTEMKQISEWFKDNIPQDKKILANPYLSSYIRLYSERNVVLTYKDGGFLILIRGKESEEWFKDMKYISDLYVDLGNETSTKNFTHAAKKYEAEYILIEKPEKLNLTLIHETNLFYVYQI